MKSLIFLLKPLANVPININHDKRLSLHRFILSGHVFPYLCLTAPSFCLTLLYIFKSTGFWFRASWFPLLKKIIVQS